ncbi:MAG: hypothetical protein KAS48_03495 [Gammaproteobacteria bacterium]|nr:hypothetical protein [Gammaproteobacteria bacterium]
MGAQANLGTGTILTFDPGVISCVLNVGTPPDNCSYGAKVGSSWSTTGAGSWFGMDTNGDGRITSFERTPITMHDGVLVGTLQPVTGSHTSPPYGAANNYTGTNFVQIGFTDVGAPLYLNADYETTGNFDGTTDTALAFVTTTTEVPGVDEPWNFFGNTGMHYITGTSITVVNPDVNGDGGFTRLLDFSGWGVTWNGIPNIPMGGGSWGSGAGDGLATIVCSEVNCSQFSDYTLDYFATVPLGDPSGFGGVQYQLHLEGTNPTEPVAAARIEIPSGKTQECATHGGSNVTLNALTDTPNSESVASITWTVDGIFSGDGLSITPFLSVGNHVVEAAVIFSDGTPSVPSTGVTVKDTTAPTVTAAFVDIVTGEPVTSIAQKGKVKTQVRATDICDPNPSVNAVVGVPAAETIDGAKISIATKDTKTFLKTEAKITTLELSVTASDAEGNASSGGATLLVQ